MPKDERLKLCVIRTVGEDQKEILADIKVLYCPKGFECDPTFSKGNFYNQEDIPHLRFDINPKDDTVTKADCRELPVKSMSVGSVVFDPPFLHDSGKSSVIGKRFSDFKTQHSLRAFYLSSLVEIYRILKPKGILVFKCQDIIESGRQVMNHCHIWQMATGLGFVEKDLFILTARNRIIGGNHKKQYHARKFHSYFWVFEKGSRR